MESHLLEQNAFESQSKLIQEQLKNTRRNLKKIGKREHEESLHDFRVSLRRLRVWLKVVGCETHFLLLKSDRKRVKHLVKLTNEARDLEVRLSLFRRHLSSVELVDKEASNLQRKWKAQIDKGYRHLAKAALKDMKKVEPGVKKIIARLRRTSRVTHEPLPLRDWLLPVLRDHARKTDDALAKIKSIGDKRQCHEARLLAKALRYLIEPVSNELAHSSDLLILLRRIQDLLGGLRDAQMLALELDKSIRTTMRAPNVRVLSNARAANAKEIRSLYGDLRNEYLLRARPRFYDAVEHLFKTS